MSNVLEDIASTVLEGNDSEFILVTDKCIECGTTTTIKWDRFVWPYKIGNVLSYGCSPCGKETNCTIISVVPFKNTQG